jgi:hypothetical protein
MNTAVQLRPIATRDSPRSDLVYGTPCEIVPGTLGPVALFASGELVAYLLRRRRRARLFVFRTLVVDDRLAAALPGVRPRVQLLLDTDSAGRSRLVQRLFAYLLKTSRDPGGLPDAFYVRVGVALAGRLPAHKILLALLGHWRGMSQVAIARDDPRAQRFPNRLSTDRYRLATKVAIAWEQST